VPRYRGEEKTSSFKGDEMKFIEEKDDNEIQLMCSTLKHLVNSPQIPQRTRQNAIIFLNEIEDRLWSAVTKNDPVDLERIETEQEEI
jgi:hypothetical protein